jgi:hypothetical protein
MQFVFILFLLSIISSTSNVCNKKGTLVTVPSPIYTCSGNTVTEERYNTFIAQNFIAKARAEQQAQVQAAAAAAAAALNRTFNYTNVTASQTPCTITTGTKTICVCRHDWLGTNCTEERPIKCSLQQTDSVDCAPISVLEKFRYDEKLGTKEKLCNFFDTKKINDKEPIKYQLNIKCKFIDERPRTCNKTVISKSGAFSIDNAFCIEDRFDYWYDNQRFDKNMFVISKNPVARVRVVFYDMVSLEYVGPNVSTNVLTGDELISSNFYLILPNGLHFVRDLILSGGRLPGEFQFTSNHEALSSLPFQDPQRKGILWEVPSIPITYQDLAYLEPFVAIDNGTAVLVVGIVLVIVLGIVFGSFVYFAKGNKKKKMEKIKRQ